MSSRHDCSTALGPLLLAAATALFLAGCGGSSGPSTDPTSQALPESETASAAATPDEVATGTTVLDLVQEELSDEDAARVLQPAFHAAPILLAEPSDVDAQTVDASADRAPASTPIPVGLDGLPTGRLTAVAIKQAAGALPTAPIGKDLSSVIRPKAVSTYTPAQIRAAYGLPALPTSGTAYATLTAAQAAQYGAGQTIYVVNAHHNPNVAAELAAFNAKFGLPACTTRAIAAAASRPLAAPAARACDFSVVYTTAAGAMTSTPPAYDAGWATEIALDVQWAHAIAPLARIVLIEASDASVGSLVNAIRLANTLGPGVVSMSFGGVEGSWTSTVDPTFTAPGMTYLAATGDSGAQVNWPSVSSNVVAVGGTSLTYTGSGARTEVGWSGTGGGTSAFVPKPAYQAPGIPGLDGVTRRTVADVAFNADPATGQYVVTIAPGSSTQNWISAGGTSLATPQWAGLVAIANATRALTAKAPLGAPHAILYGPIASVPGVYASAFADLTLGSHGSCATCTARIGYDSVGGLGTPNASSLVPALAGAAIPATPPTLTAATITGQVGTALTFTVSAHAANALAYTLTGAPSGMTIAATGVVSWPKPVAGTYPVTVTARDSVTGLTGAAVYTVTIAAPRAPTVTAATVSGTAGVALSHTVAASAPNAVTWTASGAPTGMTLSSAGVLAWAKPVVGTYAVTVTARDGATGLTGSAVITVRIGAATAAPAGLVVTAPPMTGTVGKPLTGSIVISAPGASGVSIGISGVPIGMSFTATGTTINATWASPRAGSYTLAINVRDSLGRSARAMLPVTVR
ncbi:MAG: hypothetical protein RJA99_5002 [Pseudomonadota bacterium]|jgi:hypothetical protein